MTDNVELQEETKRERVQSAAEDNLMSESKLKEQNEVDLG